MEKNKKSKKENIEKLREVLDNDSKKDLHPEDEKYLKELSKRLKASSQKEIVYTKRTSEQEDKNDADYLKARVTIHAREVKKRAIIPEVKEETAESETKIPLALTSLPATEVKDKSLEDEDAFEVEKVEIKGPEFIEVISKPIEKQEELIPMPIEKNETKDNEKLTEWEPVDIKKEEVADKKLLDIEKKSEVVEKEPIKDEKKSSIVVIYCTKCGAKLKEGINFCTECGNKTESDIEESKEEDKKKSKNIEEESSFPEFISVKKEKDSTWEPIDVEETKKEISEAEVEELLVGDQQTYEESIIEKEVKIGAFKDIESIDNETAVILYDNGYTNVDTLIIASVKDLTKIKGIKKKIAKNIKRELEKKDELEPVQPIEKNPELLEEEKIEEINEDKSYEIKPIIIGESAEKEITPEQLESKEQEELLEREVKIEAFKEVISIDEDTAVLLYNNGFTTVDALMIASVKDLAKIKGIKRKTAKSIKKEIDELIDETVKVKPIAIGESAEGEIKEEQIKNEDETFDKEKGLPSPVELSSKSSEWNAVEEDEVDEKVEDKQPEEQNVETPGWEPINIDEAKGIEEEVEADLKKEDDSFNEETAAEEQRILEEIEREKETKIDVFKDISSINDVTAVILYDNGFTTVDELKNADLKDLTKIKGIKKNTAKKIIKEIVEVEEETKFEEEIVEPEIDNSYKLEAFKEVISIDDDTAVLLYDNGFTTVDELKNADLKDLTKIKGIKKKLANNIKKEIDEKFGEPETEEPDEEFSEYFIDDEDESKELDKKIEKHEIIEDDEDIFGEFDEDEDIPQIEEDVSEDAFKDVKSINQKISKLLYENGMNSVTILNKKTIKDLTKIHGIKKKNAKEIKKEVAEIVRIIGDENESKKAYDRGSNPFIDEEEEDWEAFNRDEPLESVLKGIRGFRHTEYILYEKEIETKTGKKQKVRFFSKGEPEGGEPIDLPKGYEVKENKKTGIPYLKKKK